MTDSLLTALKPVIGFLIIGLGLLPFGCGNYGMPPKIVKLQAAEENSTSVQYLAFQIFTRASDSPFLEKSVPPSLNVENTVDDIDRKSVV